MDEPGHEILPDAGFAGDENLGVCSRGELNLAAKRFGGAAAADQREFGWQRAQHVNGLLVR